ncbi:hypothetical protein QOZ80_5AG0407390 [Eleusine coracana subsp. coracana]|nr:hypothetical protein QOZ80_5AG0407390 [Eleusine coracana subsp. coracana]
MDGAASTPALGEQLPSGCALDLEPRRTAAAVTTTMEDEDEKGRGYVDWLLGVSLHLLRDGLAPEIRRHGFNLMLHLWRCRCDDLCIDEWGDSDLMLYNTTSILPSKSTIAALMAESVIIGIASWNDLAPSAAFLSKRGSTEAQLVCSIWKRILDSRIACTIGREGGQFEATLDGQDEVPPDVMPKLSSGIVTGDFEGSLEYTDDRNLGIVEMVSCHHQCKGQLLLVEHIMLSKAFITVASSPRAQNTDSLLIDLLKNLNKIWTQPDWEDKYTRYKYCLTDLLANNEFTSSFHLLVKSFEELISKNFIVSQGECSSTSAPCFYSLTLAKLMLHLILRVLNCIQICWEEPLTYDLSGVRAENMLSDTYEVNLLKNAKTWLHGIQVTGYRVIGLCASLDGAFYGLLDHSFVINVLMKNLESMEFNHLGKLIQFVLVPLVKYCPRECWDQWMLKLLKPVFGYCKDIFYHGWFTFLHEGRPKVPPYFGILRGPEEIVIEFEKEILLKFTRSVSDLLWAIASKSLSSELSLLPLRLKKCLKNDSRELKTMSLTGYLLHYNCFGKLSMYLFGCLADYQAARKALPFCYALIDVAVTADLEWLRLFLVNEMLPTIILLLDDFPCAISKLSSSQNPKAKEDARNDITHLCQQIYELFVDKQVLVDEGEITDTLPACFKDWLAKELTGLHTRASCGMPEKFPKNFEWKWEFNEEFERYLPTYMNMLIEVEAMDDCLKDNYLIHEILLKKLKPEFKSRYAINSDVHPYLQTMSHMLQRKMPATYYKRRTEWFTQLLTQLIRLKPYIKLTDCSLTILERLEENCEPHFDLLLCNPAWAVDIFLDSILFFWEPQFHPLIREGHTELLKTIAEQLAFAEGCSRIEPLEPHPDDFVDHLWPYAYSYIKRKKEESGYFMAEKQVHLHKEFDEHLASGTLDHRMTEFDISKDDFVHKIVADLKNNSFETLDPDLIRMSFERRAKIVEWECEMSYYIECLTCLQNNEKVKKELESLISLLDAEGFFKVDDDSTDWNNKLFSDSLEKFNKVVFSGKFTDKCLVIRGIMDYKRVLQLGALDWPDAVRAVVRYNMWKEHLQQFWVETRHYEHKYYNILAQPLQKVFSLGGA